MPQLLVILLAGAAALSLEGAQAPLGVGTATDIPGVVRGGTPIERILTGYDGLDDPIGLTDGSLVFSEPGARRVHRLNPRTLEVSVLVAESNESHGVTEDGKGRLISAQAWDGSTRIGVIHPPSAVATLADAYEGQPFISSSRAAAACTSPIPDSRGSRPRRSSSAWASRSGRGSRPPSITSHRAAARSASKTR